MLTTAESLRQEGRLEGYQEGLEIAAVKLLTYGFDIETTAKISELPIPTVQRIAKKLALEKKQP